MEQSQPPDAVKAKITKPDQVHDAAPKSMALETKGSQSDLVQEDAQRKLSDSAQVNPGTAAAFKILARQPEPNYLELSDPFKEPSAIAHDHDRGRSNEAESAEQGLLPRTLSWLGGAADVSTQVVEGAAENLYNHVVEHPGETALTVVGGVVIGAALIGAAPLLAAAGATAAVATAVVATADAAVIGLTAVGAISATESAVSAYRDSSESASVLMDKSQHTAEEIEAARRDVRDKTGTAALEVAGAAIGLAGSVVSGIRLTSTVSGVLKTSTSMSKVASEISSTPSVTTGGEIVSAPATRAGNFDAAVEARPPLKSTPEASAKPESEGTARPATRDARDAKDAMDSTDSKDVLLKDLPPGSVERLSERIDDALLARPTSRVQTLSQRVERLSAANKATRLKFGMAADRFYGREDLAEPAFMREQLADNPEALKLYEKYHGTEVKIGKMQETIDAEMTDRRKLVAIIINEEASNLFPSSKLPTFEVGSLSEDASAKATYASGKINLKDRDLFRDPLSVLVNDSHDLPASITHEMKHGEQDVLLIRHYIDQVTEGSTSIRELTDVQSDAVAEKFWHSTGTVLPPRMLTEANNLRAGQILSPAEVERAESLAAGRLRNKIESPLKAQDRRTLEMIRAEINDQTAAPDNYLLEEPELLKTLFDGKLPTEMEKLVEEMKTAREMGAASDVNFEAHASDVLLEALQEQEKIVRGRLGAYYDNYRAWTHEQESWQVGDAAANRTKPGPEVKTIDDFLGAIFGRPSSVNFEEILNDENYNAFSEIDHYRLKATPEREPVYERVLRAIADEKQSLKEPAVMSTFLDRLIGESAATANADDQAALESIVEKLRQVY